MYGSPQKLSIKTIEKQVLNRFIEIAEAKTCISMSVTLDQIVFG
jgi:hypothetical protein